MTQASFWDSTSLHSKEKKKIILVLIQNFVTLEVLFFSLYEIHIQKLWDKKWV